MFKVKKVQGSKVPGAQFKTGLQLSALNRVL